MPQMPFDDFNLLSQIEVFLLSRPLDGWQWLCHPWSTQAVVPSLWTEPMQHSTECLRSLALGV